MKFDIDLCDDALVRLWHGFCNVVGHDLWE